MNPCNALWLAIALLASGNPAGAQVPVNEAGESVSAPESVRLVAEEELTTLTADELEELVGPIALYADDLLAIILPASTYPLQVVQAARFVEEVKTDSSLQPSDDWDDAVVALTNYPEVVTMMAEDLDWTWQLGEAVVAQQTDVISAIEAFRDRAYAAGNLKSDDFQEVVEEDGIISITPVEDDVIYVPYYEPEEVIVYQPRRVYYYYPRSYPVYYYPYPAGHAFHYDYFWGVTTAFSIGWYTNHLHVWHHSYLGHPYYGHHYWNNWWYRSPSVHVHNTYYVNNYNYHNRHRHGDYWKPRERRTIRSTDQRITRTRYYAGTDGRQAVSSTPLTRNSAGTRNSGSNRPSTESTRKSAAGETGGSIKFRSRSGDQLTTRGEMVAERGRNRQTDSSQPVSRQPAARNRSSLRSSDGDASLRSSAPERPVYKRSTVDHRAAKPSRQQPSTYNSRSTNRQSTPQRSSYRSSTAPGKSYEQSAAPRRTYAASSSSRASAKASRSSSASGKASAPKPSSSKSGSQSGSHSKSSSAGKSSGKSSNRSGKRR
jgi:hypothetical protein